MTKDSSETSEASLDSNDSGLETLDLSQYRTKDLAAHLTAVLSIPGAILRLFLTAMGFAIVWVATIVLMYVSAGISGVMWIILCAYALITAGPLGLILGLLRIVYQSLGNVEQILKIVLETADRVAEDAEKLRSGTARMPTGSELVAKVYDDVVAPTIEEVISGAFFFLSGPFNFIYRRTIGASVKLMLKRTEVVQLSEEEDLKLQKQMEQQVISASAYSESVKRYTGRAAKVVGAIGRGLRRYVMTPLFILYCLLLAAAAFPILGYRFYLGRPLIQDSVSMLAHLGM